MGAALSAANSERLREGASFKSADVFRAGSDGIAYIAVEPQLQILRGKRRTRHSFDTARIYIFRIGFVQKFDRDPVDTTGVRDHQRRDQLQE